MVYNKSAPLFYQKEQKTLIYQHGNPFQEISFFFFILFKDRIEYQQYKPNASLNVGL